MIKKVVSIIILVSYLLGTVSALVPIIEYSINYAYIVKELCVMKDAEENTCNGMCHLSKEVAKEFDGESSKEPQNVSQDKELNLHLISYHTVLLLPQLKKIKYGCADFISQSEIFDIPTPPPRIII